MAIWTLPSSVSRVVTETSSGCSPCRCTSRLCNASSKPANDRKEMCVPFLVDSSCRGALASVYSSRSFVPCALRLLIAALLALFRPLIDGVYGSCCGENGTNMCSRFRLLIDCHYRSTEVFTRGRSSSAATRLSVSIRVVPLRTELFAEFSAATAISAWLSPLAARMTRRQPRLPI